MYEESAINRLRFIKNAQHLGFSLSEIEKLLTFGVSKDSTAADVLKLTEGKIKTHKNKIKELQKIQTLLVDFAKQCSGDGPVSECPILKICIQNPKKKGKTNYKENRNGR
jgi:MerR family copper efflux transcriptional regulator